MHNPESISDTRRLSGGGAAASLVASLLSLASALFLVSEGSAADVELASSPFRIDGDVAGGRFGTSVVDALGVFGGTAPALMVGAYLADVGADEGAGTAYVFDGNAVPGVIGASSAVATISADQTLARLGFSAASRGDWNDDGTADLAIGAWSADGDDFDNGAVYVFFGGPALTGDLSAAAADVVLRGNDEIDHFGWSLVMTRDVNDDLVADLVVGAPLAQGEGVSTGAVYVFYGGASRTTGTSLVAADAELTFVGAEPEAGVGSAVACGEIDGDFPSEIAIGAPNRDFPGRFNAGAVYLIEGTRFFVTGSTIVLDTDADRVIMGESNSDAFGTFVAMGKVNDDSRADVIVGAPLARVSGNNFRGRCYVFDAPDPSGADLDAATDAATRLLGLAGGEVFGTSAALVGDIDGDGFREFVVGSPGVSRPSRASCGAAYVYRGDGGFPPSGPADVADFTYIGATANEEAGASVTGVTDFDLDGSADLVVGAPGFAGGTGVAYVIAGSGAVDVGESAPVAFIAAPRPNPFTRTVSIRVDRVDAAHVDVFDTAGRRVRVLSLSDGDAAWDGRDERGRAVSPGVYVLRVRGVDGAGATKRVTLLR